MSRIYLSSPHMGEKELVYVQEAFATNWIAPVGPHLNAFEAEFGKHVGSSHAAGLSSGTAALHLALRLAGVERGDEVVCSTLTFVASVNPIVQLGGIPVFVDSDTRSWNMDPVLLRALLEKNAKIGRLPKAVVLVHIYGQSADLDPISEVCDEFDIPLIEDAAQSLGALYFSKRHRGDRQSDSGFENSPDHLKVMVGTVGSFGIYSFNGNKIITTSGGGMLVTRNENMANRARFLATQARDDAPHYEHSVDGYNYRLSNVLAGIGRGQLEVLTERIEARRGNFDYYFAQLGGLPGIEFMPEAEFGRCTRWLTCLTIDPVAAGGITSETVRSALEREDVEARPVWKPMHQQPLFAKCEVEGGEVSEHLFRDGICLPSGSNLTQHDLDKIVSIVAEVWSKLKIK